jgi:alkyl hydroperoxide reductase subunit AhpC
MIEMFDHFLILVCPAGWRPGSDTIIPNPEEKLKYFSKNYETKKN